MCQSQDGGEAALERKIDAAAFNGGRCDDRFDQIAQLLACIMRGIDVGQRGRQVGDLAAIHVGQARVHRDDVVLRPHLGQLAFGRVAIGGRLTHGVADHRRFDGAVADRRDVAIELCAGAVSAAQDRFAASEARATLFPERAVKLFDERRDQFWREHLVSQGRQHTLLKLGVADRPRVGAAAPVLAVAAAPG